MPLGEAAERLHWRDYTEMFKSKSLGARQIWIKISVPFAIYLRVVVRMKGVISCKRSHVYMTVFNI